MQRTKEWLEERKGKFTASTAVKLLSKETTEIFKTYCAFIYAERCNATFPKLKTAAIDHGNNFEEIAKKEYELKTHLKTQDSDFIEKENYGCSPDALVLDPFNGRPYKGLEIKCPYQPENHFKLFLTGEIRKDYIAQCQFSMFVTGFNEWDFMSYFPDCDREIYLVTLKRDNEMIDRFKKGIKAAEKFIKDARSRNEKESN